MKVLDQHGNYGVVVRFTNAEYDALMDLATGLQPEESDE